MCTPFLFTLSSSTHSCMGYLSAERFQSFCVTWKNTQSNNLIYFLRFQKQIRYACSSGGAFCASWRSSSLGCKTVLQWFVIVEGDTAISDTAQDWWPLEGAGPTGKYQKLSQWVWGEWLYRETNEVMSYLQETYYNDLICFLALANEKGVFIFAWVKSCHVLLSFIESKEVQLFRRWGMCMVKMGSPLI